MPAGSLGDPALALPASWAQQTDMINVLTDMRSVMVSADHGWNAYWQPSDRHEVANIAIQEIKLEQSLLGSSPVIESQLINSLRRLEALGNLCESLVSDLLSL
jgi:exocyst complex component 4